MSDRAPIESGSVPELHPMYLFRWEDTQDSFVLLYPEGVVKLNATAAEILKRCDGQTTVNDLIEDMQAQFAESPERIARGVQQFLEVSYAKGWLRTRA